MNIDTQRGSHSELVEQVDALGEEVKILALNLAIYLAKAKTESDRLSHLESDFIRLVNGTVKAVRELAGFINTARNSGAGVVEQSESQTAGPDPLEARLRCILDQCGQIMTSLSQDKDSSSK
ncbi:MAG: hypothetical protein KOO62_13195 [candidate division Zixibacteria bacterium]|nr:hypothetical protein [candidate division Zixibacteria bacterium]